MGNGDVDAPDEFPEYTDEEVRPLLSFSRWRIAPIPDSPYDANSMHTPPSPTTSAG
jgi:hypothetical protein